MRKVILIEDDGKQEEFERFVLTAFKDKKVVKCTNNVSVIEAFRYAIYENMGMMLEETDNDK